MLNLRLHHEPYIMLYLGSVPKITLLMQATIQIYVSGDLHISRAGWGSFARETTWSASVLNESTERVILQNVTFELFWEVRVVLLVCAESDLEPGMDGCHIE